MGMEGVSQASGHGPLFFSMSAALPNHRPLWSTAAKSSPPLTLSPRIILDGFSSILKRYIYVSLLGSVVLFAVLHACTLNYSEYTTLILFVPKTTGYSLYNNNPGFLWEAGVLPGVRRKHKVLRGHRAARDWRPYVSQVFYRPYSK